MLKYVSHYKNKVSFILALLVFLNGMCFGGVRTDLAFTPTPVEKPDSYIGSVDVNIEDEQLCTTEMLGVRNDVGVQSLTVRNTNAREIKQAPHFLCVDAFSLEQEKCVSSSQAVQVCSPCRDELVVDFIHKSDGKKKHIVPHWAPVETWVYLST